MAAHCGACLAGSPGDRPSSRQLCSTTLLHPPCRDSPCTCAGLFRFSWRNALDSRLPRCSRFTRPRTASWARVTALNFQLCSLTRRRWSPFALSLHNRHHPASRTASVATLQAVLRCGGCATWQRCAVLMRGLVLSAVLCERQWWQKRIAGICCLRCRNLCLPVQRSQEKPIPCAQRHGCKSSMTTCNWRRAAPAAPRVPW